MTFQVITFPTFRLLYPGTKLPNPITVDTSSLYEVALADALQLASMAVHAAFEPGCAAGAAGVAGRVA